MGHPGTGATLVAIAIGGGLGAVARYGVALAALAVYPRFPPAGTLIANVLGCLVIGILMVLAQASIVSELQRQLWVTGFLGGLTTFSTYGWQTIELAREQRYGMAMLNLAANLVLGLGAVLIGIWIAQRAIGN
jgi:CrcB protein